MNNSKIKVRFLGTGTSQGVPVIACPCPVCHSENKMDKRLRSSLLIETNGQVFTIDAGPDFRYQLLREHVSRLDGILITHNHKDHIAGLDDVRSFNYLMRKPMDIYATTRDQQAIKKEFSYAFSNSNYPGVPSFKLHRLTDEPFHIGTLSIQPLPALHLSMEVHGFRIGGFAYLTDTNYLPAATMAQLLDCKIIVLNALRKEPHVSHYNLEQAVRVLEFLRPEKAYLTHISHLMGFHSEVEKELPDFIRLAHDGLRLEV
ncbi:MAG: MBL fold metallo-hydrolase [Bacteroidales bacterium]|nr:MBL fold metallo-hydrolase [Bacteroidales bacterium]